MRNIFIGAVAGAVGTLALDAASYGDMAARGRKASGTPAEVIRRVASIAGVASLATPHDLADDVTKARRSALGALSGYAIGIGIGVAFGMVRPYLRRLPGPIAALAVGAAAMAAADVPAAKLGATDVKKWGVAAWASDAIPHALFGVVTTGVADAMLRKTT